MDCETVRNSDPDLPSEVEFVGSSSSATQHRSGAALAVIYDGSARDDGTEAEFVGFSDEQLRDCINRWRKETKGLLAAISDGGEKMRIRLNRMKKELERREVVRQRKEDAVQGQQARLTGGSSKDPSDPYDFTRDDCLSDNMYEKYPISPHPVSNIKTCVQAKGIAFSKMQRPFSQHEHAYPNKNGQTAKTSASRQLKTIEIHPKSSAKSLNMYNESTEGTRKRPLQSCNRRQKNNIVLSKCSRNKFADDGTSRSDSDERDASKIYYPSSTDSGAVELTHSDMKCLEPEAYLKSPIINFYIQYLKNARPCEDLYMFNTYFYCKLEEALSTMGDSDSQFFHKKRSDSQFTKLRKWWKGVDIFKKSYIILPINEMMHWSLIIVCMPTNETESGPVILHLDSLRLHPSQKLFDIVQRFLEAEWRHLQKDSSYDVPFSRKIWGHLPRYINKEKVQVPRQRNEYDCGLFMLYYIDRFIQEAPERLTTEELCMFGCKWFQPKDASGLREGIRTLLCDVFQNAQEDGGSSVPESQLGDHSEGGDKDVNTDIIILDDE